MNPIALSLAVAALGANAILAVVFSIVFLQSATPAGTRLGLLVVTVALALNVAAITGLIT